MVVIAATEAALYDDVWSVPAYRKWSPGLAAVPRFVRLVQPSASDTVFDFGCGAGKAGEALTQHVMGVALVDHTRAGLEVVERVGLKFYQHTLWREWHQPGMVSATHGFCCDVLEHIPTELTGLTIARMLALVRGRLYLEVSTVPDGMGVFVGQALHKTVQPFTWWLHLCREIGTVVHGIDLLDRAVFVLEP